MTTEQSVDKRHALMAVVRACAERRAPLPPTPVLAAVLGVGRTWVTIHLNRLMDRGAFNIQRGPKGQGHRRYPVLAQRAAERGRRIAA